MDFDVDRIISFLKDYTLQPSMVELGEQEGDPAAAETSTPSPAPASSLVYLALLSVIFSFVVVKLWSGIRGSNSRPIPWQGIALPTELIPQSGGL